MKIIVVGVGKTGQSLIKNLSDENHDIIGIDTDGILVQSVIEKYDINGISGNGCLAPILEEAGAASADLLIAVTNRDELNLLCCLVGKSLGVKHLIAQVRNPEYYSNYQSMGERLGINMFVNLESTLADRITRILKAPAEVNLNSFAGGKLEIAEISVSKDSEICGKTLIQMRARHTKDFLVVAIERGDEVIVPNGNTSIRAGDVLSVCAKHRELRNIFGYFGIVKEKVQTVFILGSNDDAYYLASELANEGFRVKVIGSDRAACERLKSDLDGITVICDDYTDKEVLDREGLANADALVAMSSFDENNIVASLYAKTRNVSKVVTVIRSDSYRGILEEISLNLALSPYELTGSEIATYVRSIDVPKDSKIISMQKIAGGKAEALHFNIGKNPRFVGKSVKELGMEMRSGILIGAIVRGRVTVIPRGDAILEENDDIIIASLENRIAKLEDILR